MTLNELPQEIQDKLNEMRSHLHEDEHRNDAYNVVLVNKEGTRYFFAKRVCECWSDDKGHYMPFGGGTHWNIKYGPVMWNRHRNPVGEWDYEWCVPSSKCFMKSMNGTEIPSSVGTKKEVLAIAKAIGIFEL